MIRLIKPYISYAEVESEFKKIFESGILTRGTYVEEFRKIICRYTGCTYSYLTTSATTALSMCLKLLNIGAGDEVAVSDFSFPASANVIEDVGARPVFIDVNHGTFNMNPEQLEKKLTNKTKAVIFVDALGNPSGIIDIARICKNKDIPLIEDAACAIGSSIDGVRCGAISDLTCFSFHPRKLLTTGEGGAITTNNVRYASALDVKLSHGSVCTDGKFDFVDYGYNYRLPELQAVMGIKQVEKLDSIVAERKKIRDEYAGKLEPLGFVSQHATANVIHNVQSLAFVVPATAVRDTLISKLREQGVESTIGTYCLSSTTYFKRRYSDVQPTAFELQEHTITLPCFSGVDVEAVCAAVRRCL